ncbi:MAG: hypothetical protein V7K46_31645 [Nostoc sp.]
MVGQLCRDEFNQERNHRIHERKEAEEQEQQKRKSQQEQLLISARGARIPVHSVRQNKRVHREPERVYLGLPEHLTHLVLWVDRKYRTNRSPIVVPRAIF